MIIINSERMVIFRERVITIAKVSQDMLLYAYKILHNYADTHKDEDGELGRVVSSINIIEPLLTDILYN